VGHPVLGDDHPTERAFMEPTIVLVHGAFAESASWDRVIDPLLAAANPRADATVTA
jgi:pimeloyl-ACP methyl ester carboxylesterase